MRNFMSRMNDNLRHFMYGRYGVDSFGRFLIGAMFVLIVLSIFIRSWILQVLIWGVLIYSYFRMFSRNLLERLALVHRLVHGLCTAKAGLSTGNPQFLWILFFFY